MNFLKKYKVGIVGCGSIYHLHAISINLIDNAEIVAVCDIKEERAMEASQKYNCKYYLDYKEMIDNEDIDVVHICTPHYLHSPITIYAANAKKHILTEKPMSITVNDAEEMIKAAKDNGVTLGVIFQNRYIQGSVLIKEALDSGDLGKILSAKASLTWDRSDEYYSTSDWKGTWEKEGGGVVIDQAIHTLDLMRWLVNSDILYVDATIGNRSHEKIEVEDMAEGVIKYRNGVTTSFYAMNYYTDNSPVEIELHCENGFAKMVGDQATIKFKNGRTVTIDNSVNETIDYGNNTKSYWGVCHYKQLLNYYNSLRHNIEPDITGEEALKTQKMICAIYASGKKSERVVF